MSTHRRSKYIAIRIPNSGPVIEPYLITKQKSIDISNEESNHAFPFKVPHAEPYNIIAFSGPHGITDFLSANRVPFVNSICESKRYSIDFTFKWSYLMHF
jgi:hypothetical protein